jgi:RNA polymerase sigma factor (sigma-70 family)
MNIASAETKKGLSTLCDAFLLEAAKQGEHAAYSELSSRYAPMVFRIVNRITRNREDAEDAMQESLMKAFIHLQTFDGRSSFSTWLTRIAINSALMVLRKKRTRPETSLESDLTNGHSQPVQHADPSLGPEKIYLQRERELNLRQAIRRLPSGLREVIEIRNAQDASVTKIAEIAGISVAATKSRLLRARKTLTTSMNWQHSERSRDQKPAFSSRSGVRIISN